MNFFFKCFSIITDEITDGNSIGNTVGKSVGNAVGKSVSNSVGKSVSNSVGNKKNYYRRVCSVSKSVGNYITNGFTDGQNITDERFTDGSFPSLIPSVI